MISIKKLLTNSTSLSQLLLLMLIFLLPFVNRAQNITHPNVPAPNGFEVNSYTGNLFYSRTVLRIPGRGPAIDITLSYNSNQRLRNWGLGSGWTFSYNIFYEEAEQGIYIYRGDGRKDLFTKSDAGFTAPKGVFDSVSYVGNKLMLRTKDGTSYSFNDNTHKKLTGIEDRNGNKIELFYVNSLLKTITDDPGRTCTFNWNINGRLDNIKIEDKDNFSDRSIVLYYSFPANNLTAIAAPSEKPVHYYYDLDSKMTGMTDQLGRSMSVVYNKDNAVGEIVSCLTRQKFSYVKESLQTFVTEDVNGKKQTTTYSYDDSGRIVQKKGNCCGYNLKYEYDADNNVAAVIDGRGYATRYTYDKKGNLLSETDAFKDSIKYEYEPVFSQVETIKDKRGYSTTFEYDSKGNLKKTIHPSKVIENYSYDPENGDLLTYTDGNRNITEYQYDKYGYIKSITDAEGGITSLIYNQWGNLKAKTDPRGATTTYEYNAMNRRTLSVGPLNDSTKYAYDDAGNLTSVTNALDNTTAYEYDGLNRHTKITSPLGITTGVAYDEKGNIISITDGNGKTTTYTYNEQDKVRTATDPLLHTEVFDYDEAGNKNYWMDKNKNAASTYTYDPLQRLNVFTNSKGGTIDYDYDANGNVTTAWDSKRNPTRYMYDELNRLKAIIDPLADSMSYSYDNNGNKLQEIDRNGNITAYEYDSLNRIVKRTDALGNIQTYTYDGNDNLLTSTNSLKQTITYGYDAENRLISFTNSLGETTGYGYDAVGNITEIKQPNGNVITTTYDADNRPVKQEDKIGIIAKYEYDGNGNVILDSNAVTHKNYTYDDVNRLSKITYANNTTQQFVYDPNGNIDTVIDQKGLATSYQYDALNRVKKVVNALGDSTVFDYDENGNRTNIKDAKGNPTSYAYDVLNRLTGQTFADGSSNHLEYDANDNLLFYTNNNGVQTGYQYDKLNRLTTRTDPSTGINTFKYDAIGQMTSAVNSNATVLFAYDGANRLFKETINGRAVVYAYNTAGRTKNITYPSGMQVVLEMDYRSRLSQIKENAAIVATFEYDAANRLISKHYRDNTTTAYTYDNVNNVTSIQVSPNNLMHIRYTYDSLNNRILTEKLHQPDFSEQYTYDALARLKSVTVGKYENGSINTPPQYNFDYDPLGNRISSKEGELNRNYFVNNLNQYTEITTEGINVSYNYDQNGNLLNDNKNSYAYNSNNNLIKIENTGGEVVYKYDALGRRISRLMGGTETFYSFDGAHVIEEKEGGIIKNYLYGGMIDQILYAEIGSSSWFYHTDDLNSIQLLTDANGTLAEQYRYTPFGLPKVLSPNNVELAASAINNVLFTGRQYEFTSQTYDYRNREMNPATGRFTQRDPLDYMDDYNAYAYVGNDPVNFIDPLGTVKWGDAIWSTLGIAMNVVGLGTGLIAATGTSWSGIGAFAGAYLAAKTSYGIVANAKNLINALYDKESSRTGMLLTDIGLYFYPCNKKLQYTLTGVDLVLGFGSSLTLKLLQRADQLKLSIALGRSADREVIRLAEKTAEYEAQAERLRALQRVAGSAAPQSTDITRLFRAVEEEELKDVLRFGDYNIHPNSTFKRFAFEEKDLNAFIKANPDRTYTKTFIDIPTGKLGQMYQHPDPGGVGKAIGIDVYENPEFYNWFDKVNILPHN